MHRTAIITGAAGGIGHAIYQAFEAAGWTSIGMDRQAAPGRSMLVDITSAEALHEAFAQTETTYGPIGAVVACAGLIEPPRYDPLDISPQEWGRIVDVNLRGTYLTCLAAAKHMKPHRAGALVTIGSLAALSGMPLHAYGPAKAAVVSLTENLAAAWGRHGLRVNCVCPGPTLTPFIEASYARRERDPARMEAMTALGRLVQPAEVAHAVKFLCSEEASAITGTTVLVDAGVRCRQLWPLFDM